MVLDLLGKIPFNYKWLPIFKIFCPSGTLVAPVKEEFEVICVNDFGKEKK